MKIRHIALLLAMGGLLGVWACTTSQKKEPVETPVVQIQPSPRTAAPANPETKPELTESQPSHKPVAEPMMDQETTTPAQTEPVKKMTQEQQKAVLSARTKQRTIEKAEKAQRSPVAARVAQDARDHGSVSGMQQARENDVKGQEDGTTTTDNESFRPAAEGAVFHEAGSAPVSIKVPLVSKEAEGTEAVSTAAVVQHKTGSEKKVSMKALVTGIFIILAVSIAFVVLRTRQQAIGKTPARETAGEAHRTVQASQMPDKPTVTVRSGDAAKPVETVQPTRQPVPAIKPVAQAKPTPEFKPVVKAAPAPKPLVVVKPTQVGLPGLDEVEKTTPVKLRQAAAVRAKKKAVKKVLKKSVMKSVTKKSSEKVIKKAVKKATAKKIAKKTTRKAVPKVVAKKTTSKKKTVIQQKKNVVSLAAQKRKLTGKLGKTGKTGNQAQIISFRRKANG